MAPSGMPSFGVLFFRALIELKGFVGIKGKSAPWEPEERCQKISIF